MTLFLARFTLFVLSLAMVVDAGAANVTIELFEQIIGPAVKTISLELQDSGEVTIESYDLTTSSASGPLTKTVLCKMDRHEANVLLVHAKSLVRGLPKTVDPNMPVMVDGPFKIITVALPSRRLKSAWFSPSDTPNSTEAQQFNEAWKQLESGLHCNRSNNSFKPNPLRSFKTPSGSSGGSA
jgi:hypothetical protein